MGNEVPTVDGGPDVACGGKNERRDALPTEENDNLVAVYFSCEADFALLGTADQPLYLFMREIPGSMSKDVDSRIEAAMRAYLTGPTPDEVEEGYFSAAAASLADDLSTVSISAGIAAVDFAPSLGDHIGNLGTSTASQVFLLEIQATAFQFPEVERLELLVDGDCDRFWKLLEMSCQTVQRQL